MEEGEGRQRARSEIKISWEKIAETVNDNNNEKENNSGNDNEL